MVDHSDTLSHPLICCRLVKFWHTTEAGATEIQTQGVTTRSMLRLIVFLELRQNSFITTETFVIKTSNMRCGD